MQDTSADNLHLKPWMEWHHGWVLCMMCPTAKTTHKGLVQYFLGVRWNKASRKKRSNWLKTHKRCGFI